MPLPMVHLAISRQVRTISGGALTSSYLLGSISPDAIHMRPDNNPEDKRRTHLLDMAGSGSLRRIHRLLKGYRSTSPESRDFAEGYATHLLADRLWLKEEVKPFREKASKGLSEEDKRLLYYREVDWIDLYMFQQAPWREEVWQLLASAQPMDFPPLLTAHEIGRWRDRTLAWYEAHRLKALSRPVFISTQDVETFIGQAAGAIAAQFSSW
jgi:hypothetical protein